MTTTTPKNHFEIKWPLTRPGLLKLRIQNLYIFQMNEHEIVKWTADFWQYQRHKHPYWIFSCLFVEYIFFFILKVYSKILLFENYDFGNKWVHNMIEARSKKKAQEKKVCSQKCFRYFRRWRPTYYQKKKSYPNDWKD